METLASNIVSVAIVLGIMIVVHEFGHYAAAKWFGVRVEVFSVGFGARLAGFRRGETDYRISAIPLGGYVKMSGENPMDEHTGDPGEFMSHPRWQRLIIAFAGPAMNIVLAVALLTGVYMVRYEHPMFLDQPAVVGWVLEGSSAEKAGILAGDRIVRIEEIRNPTWEQVLPKVLLSPNQPLDLAIQRGDQVLALTIRPEAVGPSEIGSLGLLPDKPNVVTAVEPGLPAEKAGIQVGDEVVALNGIAMRSMPALQRYLQENQSKPVEVTVVRGNRQVKFTLVAVKTELEGEELFRIGIMSDPQHVDKLPFAAALRKSLEQNKRNSLLIVELMKRLIARKVSLRQIDGPIGIAGAAGAAARREGWTPLLALMAAISLNLGIFN
ncbi:MAG: RIP metalloprotease RseP, partial [Terriglobales bacterium]